MSTDTLEQFTCIGCNETVTENDTYYQDSHWSTVKDGTVCYGCFEDDTNYGSTLVTVGPGGTGRVLLGDYVTIDLDYGDYELPSYLDYVLPDGWAGTVWVNSGGYRGYHNSIENFKNITKLADGWTTGWVDDTVARKHLVNDLLGQLEDGEITPPAPIHVLLETTSNIFSTAIDIFTADKDAPAVIEWLQENGYSVTALQDAAN